jgi:hypothetical protein
MTPTNEQLAGHLKQIANRLDDTGEFLESVAFALANQFKLIAARMPGLEPNERDGLQSAAQQALNGVMKHKASRKLLKDAIQIFSNN